MYGGSFEAPSSKVSSTEDYFVFAFRKGGKAGATAFGVFDDKPLLPTSYDDIRVHPDSRGTLIIRKDGKFQKVIFSKGKVEGTSAAFDDLQFLDGSLLAARQPEGWRILWNLQPSPLGPYEGIEPFGKGFKVHRTGKTGVVSVVDYQLKEILEPLASELRRGKDAENEFVAVIDGAERRYNYDGKLIIDLPIASSQPLENTTVSKQPSAPRATIKTTYGGGIEVEELPGGSFKVVKAGNKADGSVYNYLFTKMDNMLFAVGQSGRYLYAWDAKGTKKYTLSQLTYDDEVIAGSFIDGVPVVEIENNARLKGYVEPISGRKQEPQFGYDKKGFNFIVVNGKTLSLPDFYSMRSDELEATGPCPKCGGGGKVVTGTRKEGGDYVGGTTITSSRPSLNNTVGTDYSGHAATGYQTTTTTTSGYRTKSYTTHDYAQCDVCGGSGKKRYHLKRRGNRFVEVAN